MRTILISLMLVMFTRVVYGDAVIFSGNDVKALKQNLDLFGTSKLMGTATDPSSGGGLAAPLSSIAMNYITGIGYIKTSAPNTGWSRIVDTAYAPGVYFSQGGNAFGAAGVLGTTDANRLDFITGGVVGMSMATTGAVTVTSSNANALAVGPAGATNPALQVDGSIASQATGIKITGAAAGSGVTVAAISSGSNEELALSSKGTSFARIQVGGSNRYSVNNQAHVFVAGSSSTASTVRYNFTGASDTTLTASTEAPSTYFNLGQTRQHATGTLSLQRDFRITPSTHSFVGASTLTNASALSVDGGPVAGTNATITNSSAIYVPGSAVSAGVTNSFGLNINANTGATNNYASVFNGGNVGIGTSSPAYALDVSGVSSTIDSMSNSIIYPVPTATNVNITVPNGSTTLVDGYAYRMKMVTSGTGVLNASSWLVYQTAVGTWTAKMIGAQSVASNHPLLGISGVNAYVYHNHASSYNINVVTEAFRHRNTTILSPYYFGIDGALTVLGGKIGMAGVTSPTQNFGFSGDSAQTIGQERHSTSAGNSFNVIAGGSLVGGTDLNGGTLILSSGISTGTGSSSISFRTATAAATGTTDNAVSTKMTLTGAGYLGVGTTGPAAQLHNLVTDAATATVTNVATFGHNTSGTPAAYYGVSFDLQMQSATIANRQSFLLSSYWADATDATRSARTEFSTPNSGSVFKWMQFGRGSAKMTDILTSTNSTSITGGGAVLNLINTDATAGSVSRQFLLTENTLKGSWLTSANNNMYLGTGVGGSTVTQMTLLDAAGSPGSVGIGILAPTSKLHQDSGTATASYHQFTANATTGQTVTDGTLIGIDASGNAIFNNQEAAYINFLSSNTQRARITALGSLVVGNNSSALATTATDGFLYVSSSSGAPTGVPTTQTGSVPVHVDATNNAMYMYTNSAWRSVAGSTVQGSRQTGTSMSVGTAITPALGAKTVAFVVGNGGAITITASPPITTTGMIVGQELKVCGTSNTNTVTYNNSVNLVLNGSATLGKDQCLNLMYAGTDGTNLSWIETGRSF